MSRETAPHYLVLNDSMLQEDGRFKMNPPIRAEEDRQALQKAFKTAPSTSSPLITPPPTAGRKRPRVWLAVMGSLV